MIVVADSLLSSPTSWNWPLAWAAMLACLVLTWHAGRKDQRGGRIGTVVFIFAVFGCLMAFRWPILSYPLELYPDESQMISGAVMLHSDPVYWRAVDGFTSGPLNHYAVMLPTMLAAGRPFFGIRLFGVLLITLVIVCSYLGARAVFSERVARASVLPLLAFAAFATDPAYVHFSSEHVPIALLSIGTLGLVRFASSCRASWLFVAGLALALVPLAKPQAAPIALGVMIVAGGLAWRSEGAGRRRGLTALAASVLIVVVGFGTYASAFGLWRDVWISYVKGNLSLARDARSPGLRLAVQLERQTFLHGGSGWLLAAVLSSLILTWRTTCRRAVVPCWFALIAGVSAAAAFASVAVATLGYPKYFLLLMPSLGLLAACAVASVDQQQTSSGQLASRLGWTVFLMLGVGLPAWRRAALFESTGHYPEYRPARETVADVVSAELRHWVKPGDFLAVWAAMPEFYVRTGCRQATRDGETSRQSNDTPERCYYRRRYLDDIARSNPRAFLDGSGANRRGFELSGFPKLDRYVQTHYRLEAEIAGFKIYVRRDVVRSGSPRTAAGLEADHTGWWAVSPLCLAAFRHYHVVRVGRGGIVRGRFGISEPC